MPSSDQTLLSIVVPSYNQGRYIRRTLESILGQSYRPLEVLVIDGASTDDTLAVVKSFGAAPELRCVSEKDRGPADAVNKGLAMAQGAVLAIQSADDIYYPDALSVAMAILAGDPACGLLYGDAEAIDTEGRVTYSGQLPQFSMEAIFATRLCIPQSSAFFRREVAREAGGWNGGFHQCDLDFWLRLLFRTRVRKIDRVLSGWRVHPEQRTQAGKGLWRDYCGIIEASDDVRRADAAIRKMAYASRHIMALDYPPDGSSLWWQRSMALRAVAAFPRSRRYLRHHLRRLFPGYERLRGAFADKL